MIFICNIYAKLAKRILSTLLSDNQIPIPCTKVDVNPCSSLLTLVVLTLATSCDAPRCTKLLLMQSSLHLLPWRFSGSSLSSVACVVNSLSIGPHCRAFIGSSLLFLLFDHFGLDPLGAPLDSSSPLALSWR